MSRITEKVAYLDGLMDGMDLKDDKYKKLFTAILDTLDVIAEEMSDHDDTLADVEDSLDEIYDELEAYDEILSDEYDDDEDEDEEADDDFFEIVCPGCGETIYFDDDMLDSPDGLICPNCNEPIDIELKMGDCDDGEE